MRAGGFTLVEVLVALAILAFVLTAGASAVRSGAQGAGALERRLFAHWVASDALTEARLLPPEATEDAAPQRREVAFMRYRFAVETRTRELADTFLLETRVEVRDAQAPGELLEALQLVHAPR